MDDYTAIVELGGVTTAEFPALERDLDYIVNYYLPFPTGPLQEVVLPDVSQSSSVTVAITAQEAVSFNVTHAATVAVGLTLSHNQTFTWTETSAADAIVPLSQAATWTVDHVANADVAIDAYQGSDWLPIHDGSVEVFIELTQIDTWVIGHAATVAVALTLSHNQTWSIDASASVHAEFELDGSSTWQIVHTTTVVSEYNLSNNSDWTVVSSGEIELEIALVHDVRWDVEGSATFVAETLLSQIGAFNVTHTATAHVAIDIEYDIAFSIQHRGVIRTKDRVNEALPVWSFEPNWSEGILETLEWMTDVLRSPSGAEQRRSLRPFPRRSFEFSIALQGGDRAFFNNLVFAHGAHDWYLPLWHDSHYLDADVGVDDFVIPCSTAAGNFRVGEFLFIGQGGSRKFEIVEVLSISGGNVTLVEPLDNAWMAGTQIYPVRLARFTEQPAPRRESDNTVTSQIRFRIIEQNGGIPVPSGLDTYRSFNVLSVVPDDNETLDLGYERILEEVDNQTAIPLIYDSANISFPVQKHSWALNGRSEHSEFLSLVYDLRGKARPLWLPTFFEDFTLAAEGAAGSTSLHVANVGYTATGGPRDSRRDIMIELLDGSRLYRRITASTALGDAEVLAVDSPLPALSFTNVFRISFMALNRLNQDQIELNHETDVEGVTRVVATFRSTPDLRQANVGF